ncbi:hypothetical protein [Petrachloros mirabilis]
MKINPMRSVAAVCLFLLTGCSATGERVTIAIPQPSASAEDQGEAGAGQAGNGLRVVVSAFEDARSDRTHVGSRSHFWGGTSYFDLEGGAVGEAVAKGIVQQLNKRGWQASLAGQGGSSQPDATISGSIQDLSVTAVSKFFTEIAAKNTMMIHVANHGDQSWVEEQVRSSASDEVFWFDSEDAQHLLNELIEKNVEKFLADTKVEGRAIKAR